MQINKIFILSCKHFGGFTMNVDINLFENKKQIIDHVLTILKDSLDQLSLDCLINLLDGEHKDYHIHDLDFGHLFINEGPFYICNHCNDFPIPLSEDTSTQDISLRIPEKNYSIEANGLGELVPLNGESQEDNSIEANGPEELVPLNGESQEDNSNRGVNNMFNLYNYLVSNDSQQIDNNNNNK